MLYFYITLKVAIYLYFSNFLNILYKTIKLTTNFIMISLKTLKTIFALILSSIILISCGGKLPGADARKYPMIPKKELKKT